MDFSSAKNPLNAPVLKAHPARPAKPPPSKLVALPTELQDIIINNLDTGSKLCLKITNHHFNTLIIKPTHAELLDIEKTWWARSRNLYTCMDCCGLRKSHHFADAMKKGPKGLNGKERHKRFCIYCGLNPQRGTTRYSRGAEITVGGMRFVFCKKCYTYTGEAGCVGSALCKKCHMRSGCECPPPNKTRTRIPPPTYNGGWRSYAYWDDLDDSYDENFWETHDPSG